MTSSRDLAKEVEEQGWRLDRSKGSHGVYVKAGCARPIVIPADRKDLPKYVVSNVRRQIQSGK